MEEGHPSRYRLTPTAVGTMRPRLQRWLSLADVLLVPAFILWFIWRLQFTARWTWILFPVWLAASFALRRDTPKTLGWRADNLGAATKQALAAFGAMAAVLIAIGLALGARVHPLLSQFEWRRVEGYFAFCVLQQVALNSLLHNRMMSLVRVPWAAACLTGLVFAACHWPNPVLVPLTFVGGAVIAWLFGRVRNIIPLAIGQVVLGLLVSWAFPITWHHHLRVGPGYYTSGFSTKLANLGEGNPGLAMGIERASFSATAYPGATSDRDTIR